MSKKILSMVVVSVILIVIAACGQTPATPIVKVETVEVVVTQEVEKIVTQEVEKIVTKEVEKQVTVVQTVEVTKEVPVTQTVEVEKVVTVEVTPEPTKEATADPTNPKVREVLSQITMVQHHYNADTKVTSFTCVSRGKGLDGVAANPEGPIYVGPNSGDLDVWGVVGLFMISSDGTTEFVPQESGGRFVDPKGIEFKSLSKERTLELFASGEGKWLGTHGVEGKIGDCDPQYITPTPE